MISALGTAASGMEAQMEQIGHLSNNIANVNTPGYKKSRAEFQDLLYETLQEPGANTSAQTQSPVGIQKGMGVRISGTMRNFEGGNANATNREFDLMVQGNGFFTVQTPGGELGYKRDGAFIKSATGRLETIEGYPLYPEVTVPDNATRVQISEQGVVTAYLSDGSRENVGQIQLATFVNQGGLKATGKNIFVATPASGPANFNVPTQNSTGHLLQGHLEASNVDVVREMTEMISAQRAFEMNAKVMQSIDQVLQHTSNIR